MKKNVRKPGRPAEQFKADNEKRLRRMEAWILRAEAFRATDKEYSDALINPRGEDDLAIGVHADFIFWWIALEAGYAREGSQGEASGSREDMKAFIHLAMRKRIRGESWSGTLDRVKDSAIALIELPPASQCYWRSGRAQPVAWEGEFRKEVEGAKRDLQSAISSNFRAMRQILLFLLRRRLYVVRNQIFHGGSSLDRSYGRPQVELGVDLLSAMVPKFCGIISSHQDVDWGPVPYPRQEPADKWPVKVPSRPAR